jgi:type I restriction enzyme S subunit
MSGLPEGWVECQIGDVASVVGGGTPDSRDPENFSLTEGIAWLTPADLSKHNGTYITRGKRFLTEKGFNASSAKLLPKGTVLFSSRAPIGYVAIAANEISTNQGFKSFLCRDGISSEYIYYWLKFAKPLAEELASGTTFAEISGKNAARIPLRLAPLNEQRRIVAKLEKLLSRVNAAQERLATIPRILKRFRQSVLAAACSGRLTADWRLEGRNNGETSAAFLDTVQKERLRLLTDHSRPPESIALDISELAETPGEWSWATVAQLSIKVVDGVHRKPDYVEKGIPFLTVRNLTAGPGISFDKTSFVTEEDHTEFIKRANPEKGDILISKDGTLGVVRLVETDRVFSIFVSLAMIKPVVRKFGSFLALMMAAPQIQQRIVVTGTGLQHIHLRDLRSVTLPIPPPSEQQEIVRRVEALFKTADALEARYRTAKTHVDKLTQSILSKAFRGELAPQDPTDEPASVLLERICDGQKDTAHKKIPRKSRRTR